MNVLIKLNEKGLITEEHMHLNFVINWALYYSKLPIKFKSDIKLLQATIVTTTVTATLRVSFLLNALPSVRYTYF